MLCARASASSFDSAGNMATHRGRGGQRAAVISSSSKAVLALSTVTGFTSGGAGTATVAQLSKTEGPAMAGAAIQARTAAAASAFHERVILILLAGRALLHASH